MITVQNISIGRVGARRPLPLQRMVATIGCCVAVIGISTFRVSGGDELAPGPVASTIPLTPALFGRAPEHEVADGPPASLALHVAVDAPTLQPTTHRRNHEAA